VEIALGLPAEFHRFAYAQDMIGWDNFMLGKISTHLHPIQYSHLLSSPLMLTVDDWMKQFIDQLIHIVQGQWIYHNISKHHDTTTSSTVSGNRWFNDTLSSRCTRYKSKFLLEVDFACLRAGDLVGQH
jgi:hypothetical protein